ncbi:MAG: hypothetical protein P8Y23_00940 [Candidatus Lokiarchaeota archaeon]|jgi:hypothetical protein
MSSKSSKEPFSLNDLKDNRTYLNMIVSKLVTPFPNEHKIEFIYDGTEDIPFKKRDPFYQSILIEEFITMI